jgi:glycosyltransferase involved in cell wall biosynthesis
LRVLVGSRPDVVHAHFGTVGAAVSPICHRLGIPLVVSFYGFDLAPPASDEPLNRAYERMFQRGCAFTAEGPMLARRLVALGAPAGRVRLLPLALPDWAVTHPPPRPARQARQLRLLQVARFVEKKGIDLSLRALAVARTRGVDASLVIAGGGPLVSDLHRQAEDLGLQGVARFIGYVGHESLAHHLGQTDAVLQPSRTAASGDTEGGHPTILIEALAQGVPVVATRHADIPFVIHHEQNGLLSRENDVEGLSENLVRLATEPGLLENLTARARGSVIRRHSPSTLRLVKERIYREAIRGHASSPLRYVWRKLPVSDPFDSFVEVSRA